jgi:hypothetical protein
MASKRPRKSATPKQWPKKAKRPGPADEQQGPIFVRPAGNEPLHPALDEQLRKPFLSTIYVDRLTKSLRYPLGEGQAPAIMDGLHRRMLHRFFCGEPLNNAYNAKSWPKHMRSSEVEGTRADRALANSIRTGEPPPPAHHKGTSPYAAAVWKYWRDNHHRPVLAQLPVIIVHARTATAGDYFTVHRCPFTQRETLCLWELKTGYPKVPKRPKAMTIPMPPPLPGQQEAETVPLTPLNRYYMQVLLTQMAYERELGLRIDGTVRVIHVFRERGPLVDGEKPVYKCRVRVVGPDDLEPRGWPNRVLRDELYQALKLNK